MANKNYSLAHTKWMCKYHIVFAPKYRRMVFYSEKKIAVGKILRQLCNRWRCRIDMPPLPYLFWFRCLFTWLASSLSR